MKQVLLMIAVVALVGCGKKEPAQPSASNSATPPPFAETKAKAEARDEKAQNDLGVMYEGGQGVPQDFKEAVKWYRKAAEQGLAIAQTNLGMMYERGRGVEQDFKEAVKWYRKAAEQGHAYGQHLLGTKYAHGQGVEQDFKEAVRWWHKAAEQGLAGTYYNLGVVYYQGRGVEQDNVAAYAWMNIAATNGDQKAQKAKLELAKEMTPAQIAKAGELVKEMLKKNPKLLKD